MSISGYCCDVLIHKNGPKSRCRVHTVYREKSMRYHRGARKRRSDDPQDCIDAKQYLLISERLMCEQRHGGGIHVTYSQETQYFNNSRFRDLNGSGDGFWDYNYE
eukprot:scaffold18371_cov56-Attheya_sp.AAC.2